MLRSDVEELHYITTRANLASLMSLGILSHRLADRVPHQSVASDEIQDRRRWKRVPNALPLHSYANLYFDARNPMLSRLIHDGHRDLVILRVFHTVLDIPGTIVCDGNAACNSTRFFPSPGGLVMLNKAKIFAERWPDPNPLVYAENKRIRNAEVLVPQRIHPSYIQGCYVETANCLNECRAIVPSLNVRQNRRIFFNG